MRGRQRLEPGGAWPLLGLGGEGNSAISAGEKGKRREDGGGIGWRGRMLLGDGLGRGGGQVARPVGR